MTLDADVVRGLEAYARQKRLSFKGAINTLIRRGLQKPTLRPKEKKKFVVKPFSSPFQPGVDFARLNQLVDVLETEEFKKT